MANKKGVNPLLVGLGLAAGAAGAVFLSKKENRVKARKAMKKVGVSGGSWLEDTAKKLQSVARDVDALTKQHSLDKEKKPKHKNK